MTDCDLEVFNPVLYASPTTNETDSASGLELELSAPQFLGFARLSVGDQIGDRHPAAGLHDQPRRGRRADAPAPTQQANFGSEGPAECPDSSKIGTFAIGTPALAGPLDGAVYIGEPKPGDQYRLFLSPTASASTPS